MADENSINVLMLGARRAGKSTLLASLVQSIMGGTFCKYLNVEDCTEYLPGEETLREKYLELQLLANPAVGKEISPDTGASSIFKDYRLKISIPDCKGDLTIVFTDGNGEFIELDNTTEYADKLKEKVASYDIILVAIDTPFLMEAVNKENRLCNEPINKKHNQIPALQTILTNVDDGEGKIARQIIFAPIKCEKWLKAGRFQDVVDRVKTAYNVVLCNLSGYTNIEIGILPVQTVGNITFTTHRTAHILVQNGEEIRCSPIDSSGERLLLYDGNIVEKDKNDILNLDSRMQSGAIRFPYSWFKVEDKKYSPRNCDMLAFYILRFVIAKTIEAKDRQNKKSNSIWKTIALATAAYAVGNLYGLAIFLSYSYLRKRLGTIKVERLQSALNRIDEINQENHLDDDMYVLQKNQLKYN